MSYEWKIIVEPMPRDEAEQALSDWLQQQAAQGCPFSRSDIREDVILSKDRRQLVRYAVQSEIR
jgi:hypothetical protein